MHEKMGIGWIVVQVFIITFLALSLASATSMHPTDDAKVDEATPGTNYGSMQSIEVGNSNGYRMRGYLKFDLSSIPDTLYVYEAKLSLYKYNAVGSADYSVHLVYDDTWNEATINWTNQPTAWNPVAADIKTISSWTLPKWYDWDVTTEVRAEAGGDDVISLLVKLDDEGTAAVAEFWSKEYWTKKPVLYVVLGHGGFEVSAETLAGIWQGDAAWSDINNDGNFDLAIHGNTIMSQPGTNASKIYSNLLTGPPHLLLSQILIDSLMSEGSNSLAWGDYDGDGDPDLAIAGDNGLTAVTQIYKNDGAGVFSFDASQNLPGVKHASLAWGDYDNDGDLDLVLAGYTGITKITRIYYNDDKHKLIWDANQSLTGIQAGSVAWVDYDVDGDLDLVISGNSDTGRITEFYKNNPIGTLVLDTGQSVLGFSLCCLAFGDYDNDGDPDLAITGSTGSGTQASYIYANDAGTFSLSDSLYHLYRSSLAWGDLNGDGSLDLAIMGYDGISLYNYVYYQIPIAGYFYQMDWGFIGVREGSMSFTDYDNDTDLDILVTGGDWFTPRVDLYKNRGGANTPPIAPTSNFSSNYSSGKLTLSWGDGSDTETPSSGLYYNVRVGTDSLGNDIRSGILVTPMLGNYLQTNSITLDVPSDVYYWSIQVIDPGMETSSWSTQQKYTPLVTVQMVPDTTPVIIPPGGGSFGFTATITNNTPYSGTVQAWIEVIMPNGNPYAGNPVVGPVNVSLTAYQTRSFHTTQSVPGGAPAGTYTYEGVVGLTYPNQFDRDGFEFTKQ